MAKIGAAQEEKRKILVSPFTKWYAFDRKKRTRNINTMAVKLWNCGGCTVTL
jgi:hypothetical protein